LNQFGFVRRWNTGKGTFFSLYDHPPEITFEYFRRTLFQLFSKLSQSL
jgi:hypothetical protein